MQTARYFGLAIPRLDPVRGTDAIDLKPNSPPTIGGGVLFKYGELPEQHHIAVITSMGEKLCLVEGNMVRGKITRRCIEWDDPFLTGFWSPYAVKYLALSFSMGNSKLGF